jgi:hypothetical protein
VEPGEKSRIKKKQVFYFAWITKVYKRGKPSGYADTR